VAAPVGCGGNGGSGGCGGGFGSASARRFSPGAGGGGGMTASGFERFVGGVRAAPPPVRDGGGGATGAPFDPAFADRFLDRRGGDCCADALFPARDGGAGGEKPDAFNSRAKSDR